MLIRLSQKEAWFTVTLQCNVKVYYLFPVNFHASLSDFGVEITRMGSQICGARDFGRVRSVSLSSVLVGLSNFGGLLVTMAVS